MHGIQVIFQVLPKQKQKISLMMHLMKSKVLSRKMLEISSINSLVLRNKWLWEKHNQLCKQRLLKRKQKNQISLKMSKILSKKMLGDSSINSLMLRRQWLWEKHKKL